MLIPGRPRLLTWDLATVATLDTCNAQKNFICWREFCRLIDIFRISKTWKYSFDNPMTTLWRQTLCCWLYKEVVATVLTRPRTSQLCPVLWWTRGWCGPDSAQYATNSRHPQYWHGYFRTAATFACLWSRWTMEKIVYTHLDCLP